MSTMMNTVAKEVIKPQQVMTLPFIDSDIDEVIVPIKTDSEARQVLREIRGY